MAEVQWDICREGRAWREEAHARYQLTPEKIEMCRGQLFWSEEDRLTMIALLLENVGVDKVVRLGDPAVWRAAIDALEQQDNCRSDHRPAAEVRQRDAKIHPALGVPEDLSEKPP